MDSMSPQQQQENKRRTKSQSYRRQSAPSLVISKALTRSKTLSRESFPVPACPETCPLVQSFLAASDRSFLLHGHAQLKTGMQTQDRHLFLFDDILVIAKVKSANHFKQKAQACVREMWTAGCTDEVCEGSTNPERSFVMGWPTCNCVATFSSAEQKERWLSLLKSRIKEEKEREEPKTIPLRVYGKGINTFAVTKTLPVSNSDSTNEVVRLALQQFGIIGNVKDFQLWVISKRDNSPYPLIGHEFPFSIQMSHVRHAAAPPLGDRQQAPKQCRFIVKPRPVETPHVPAELSQKPFRRRRSLIAWAFWRGSSPQLNELCPARGRLFGRPLSCVCVEGALPKPVTEMLAFLYHEGSRTRGIFRRPAGARAVRELRESLDAGEFQLPLSRDHVFIIAGVFKDFLRSIPGSLLRCELHEEWMDVLEEEEEEEEQVRDIQRMIGRLPKENALLLRYLLAVLLAIQGNAHENQMTSFNIAVCIAPSVLWPPGAPGSPEVEGEGTKKVCELVKFMIEHCEQILGEDPSSLFGGPPRTPGTESWSCGLTDSSYDGSGGSPGFCSRRHLRPKPLQGSLDSILTFSDHDQDAPSTLDSLSLDGRRRRRSEPALAKFAPNLHSVRSTVVHVSSSSSLEARWGLCPTKEAVNRGALKGCMGLHPNSWLKKGRRLSLTRQDKLECEEEYKAGGRAADERPDSGGPALSLFKQNKSRSVEEECDAGLYRRRGSEPVTRARLPSDPGLKVTEVDSQGPTSEARFCLSPLATRAVRDYFSSHLRSNPHSSHREWQKRRSAEPDFDRLLFAEESYV